MLPRVICTGLIISLLLTTGCSTTVRTGFWKDPNFKGQVKKVYIIGIAKSETTRRIFEDNFRKQLATYNVIGISSYNDLPVSEEINKEGISARANENGADAIMLARAIGKTTEQTDSPGNVLGRFDYGPNGAYIPESYCRTYDSYFERSCKLVFKPVTKSKYEVVTIEANLYDTKTSELIWSAQLGNSEVHDLQALIADFIKTVTKDLKAKGLI